MYLPLQVFGLIPCVLMDERRKDDGRLGLACCLKVKGGFRHLTGRNEDLPCVQYETQGIERVAFDQIPYVVLAGPMSHRRCLFFWGGLSHGCYREHIVRYTLSTVLDRKLVSTTVR